MAFANALMPLSLMIRTKHVKIVQIFAKSVTVLQHAMSVKPMLFYQMTKCHVFQLFAKMENSLI